MKKLIRLLIATRSDPTLQDIVYKIVPGLFKDEMKRRHAFYQKWPEASKLSFSGEERGEFFGERIIYSNDDIIPLSIEYLPQVINYSYMPFDKNSSASSSKDQSTLVIETPVVSKEEMSQRRYLRCEGEWPSFVHYPSKSNCHPF